MVIIFKDNKLERIFSSERTLKTKYGEDCARKIIKILDRLRTFENLGEYHKSHFGKMDRLHNLHGDRKGEYAIDVIQPYRIVLEACDESGKKINKSIYMINIVKIKGVENYHGK